MSKKSKSILIVAVVLICFGSCKNEEQKNAELAVEDYTKYVDSISKIATSEAIANWESIQTDLDKAKAKAEVSVKKVSNKSTLQSSIDKVYMQYGEYKNTIISEKNKGISIKSTNPIRTTSFWETFVANNMKFDWINKDNVFSVYKKFVKSVQKNTDSYSKEDWDEIKLLHEALDFQKSRLEKQGLTESHNNKIIKLKEKFNQMFSRYRLVAKSEKNMK